jgi:putative hydrolase of HD superfamily
MTLPPVAAFLLEIDALKLTERRSYIGGGKRLENSGEHSWHVAMAAWALARYLAWDVSLEKVLKLALIHDLGELDAGDTFLYSTSRQAGVDAERACIARLGQAHAALMPELPSLWEEQECGDTAESRVVKIADRLLPFLHNIASQGKTWREHGVAKSQVLEAHRFIGDAAPELFDWMQSRLEDAIRRGWLKDDCV